MFATQVLPETPSEESEEENNSDIVGYVVAGDKEHEVKKGETKIGRDSSMCSIVIENFTVSKVHAVIESDGVDESFIYDVGSTNQTRLGKKVLKPHCRYKLEDSSKITLGNVVAHFSVSSQKSSMKQTAVSFNAHQELDDIFDLPTQVTLPQPTSSNVLVFEKSAGGFKVTKTPANTSRSAVGGFEKDFQSELNSREAKLKSVFCNNPLENSDIFSLNTQCQLPPATQENKVIVSDKNSGSDKITSLLNDGQDDVLCTFMSLHSPSDQTRLLKGANIKTEMVDSQLFDAPTQAQIQESVEEKERRELSELLQNKDLIEEDFPIRNSCLLTTTSTPLNREEGNDKSDSCTQHLDDEDFIETQQFIVDNSESVKEKDKADDFFQDDETQSYIPKESSMREGKDDEEDLILTQTFNDGKREPSAVIPETEELNASQEDFIGTQIFPLEGRGSGPIPESRDASSLNLTQRNSEDDFIATQIFEGPTFERKTDSGSGRSNSDDEDFIATQIVNLPVNKDTSSKKCEEAASRGSSPDLLTSDTFSKNVEDYISTQIFEPPDEKKVTEPVESSGEETESDLEIMLDQSRKFIKSEREASSTPISRSPTRQVENDNSNSSYVFELEPKNDSEEGNAERVPVTHLTDSDATDCEEVAISSPKIKQEPIEKVEFEDTQVLTLSLPDNFAEKPVTAGAESPKFEMENEREPWSPLSLEMPNTQEIESTVKRILEKEKKEEFETPSKKKKTEVGLTNVIQTYGSPLKRLREGNSGEAVPVKKTKKEETSSQKLLTKLVKTHDIAQIQPSRTRNSTKNVENKPEVKNNVNPTSRRKATGRKVRSGKNGDITPYLARKEEKKPENENEPVEISRRVLRSSRKNSENGAQRKSPRNSYGRKEERFDSVVFTGFGCEFFEKVIDELGGKKTNDVAAGQVVVSDRVRRSVKFLCAIGLSLPIASPQWLVACKKEKKFVNPWDFILKDEEGEETWGFELKKSLEKSKKVKLLEGFSIFATKSTKPPVKELLAIVECCGGTPLFEWPNTWPKKTIFVSCLEDKKWWPIASNRNVKIVHYEFILSGVLRQKIDFKTYKLR